MDHVTRADFRAGVDRLGRRISGVEGRMDGLESQLKRLTMEQIKMRAEMATKADIEGLSMKFQAMYQIALEASERARASFNKLLAHGDILQDHEARLRGLERRPS